MFYCNGWCFLWVVVVVVGVNICLCVVCVELIFWLFCDEKVMYFCGVFIVLNMLVNVFDEIKGFDYLIKVMIVGVLFFVIVIVVVEVMGIDVIYIYGLIEIYGFLVVCVWKDEWDDRFEEDRVCLKLCQGVCNVVFGGLMVVDFVMLELVFVDGVSMGEIFMCGNVVMKGYLKNFGVIKKSFCGGWFVLGDLGVMYVDGYIELKDCFKDIIILGGENILLVEVEDVLYCYFVVMEVVVVVCFSVEWGEIFCVFVVLKFGCEVGFEELIVFCC